MLFRPIFLLARNSKRKDLHVAHHAAVSSACVTELTDTPVTNGAVYASFFVSFGRRLGQRDLCHCHLFFS
jgi:hypothetical protein